MVLHAVGVGRLRQVTTIERLKGTSMRSAVVCALAITLTVFSFHLVAQSGPAPAADARFRAIPDTKNIGEYMRRLSARPHHVGSAYDKDNAEGMLAKLKAWGCY